MASGDFFGVVIVTHGYMIYQNAKVTKILKLKDFKQICLFEIKTRYLFIG